jgi:hypothetical protein
VNEIKSIDYLNYPYYLHMSQIKSIQSIHTHNFRQVECIKSNDESIYMVNRTIQEFSLDNKKLKEISTNSVLGSSYICDIDNFTIFLVDIDKGTFHVFIRNDNTINTQSSYNHECFIGSNYTHSSQTSRRLLTSRFDYYVSNTQKNTLYVLKRKSTNIGPLLISVHLSRPKQSKAANKRIFIVSDTTFSETNGKLEGITGGENCVYELDISSLKIEKKIRFDDWLAPKNLWIDKDFMIYTIAYDLSPSKHIGYQSIFIINPDGYCTRKISLDFIMV